jgi:hypothetical protein
VVVAPDWWRGLSGSADAVRHFVAAHDLHRFGEGDVLVLFVELLLGTDLPPDIQAQCQGHDVVPRIHGWVHESDPDSPSRGWTTAEQREAIDAVSAQLFGSVIEVNREDIP